MKPARNPKVTELEQNLHRLQFADGRILYLVGTAHVSTASADLVERVLRKYRPDTVCVELDAQRLEGLMQQDRFKDLDIVKIIRSKQLFFFIGQFIMSTFQKKMAEKTGAEPGMEFRRAVDVSRELGARLVLADRNIGITLKRAWRITRFWSKMKLLASVIAGKDENLDDVDIESLKSADAIHSMVESFSDELPDAKRVLIDERDAYLTSMIQENLGRTTVAAVGAGHVPGMLQLFATRIIPADERAGYDRVPPRSMVGRMLPWLIPAIVMAGFVWGFSSGKADQAMDAAVYWILVNGILTALGCFLAFGHPLTAVSGFIAAPITSLNPTIGAGFVTAFVQTMLVKPRIRDIDQIRDKTLRVRQWWHNRLTKVFLVFLFSSIGSSIGTFVALPVLLKLFGK